MKLMKIFENYVSEAIVDDPNIKEKIANFYELQKKIKEMEANLKEMKSEFGEFEELITPIIDGLKEVKDRTAETGEYIIEISRFGGEQTNVSYKDAFENALSKVNGATKRVLQEALEASKKTTRVKHSFSINKAEMSEASVFDKLKSMVKSAVSKFIGIFRQETKNIDSGNAQLRKLASSKGQLKEDASQEPYYNDDFKQKLKTLLTKLKFEDIEFENDGVSFHNPNLDFSGKLTSNHATVILNFIDNYGYDSDDFGVYGSRIFYPTNF
jgi:hypothetical protein